VIDNRGPVMGQGSYYSESTDLSIFNNEDSEIKTTISGAEDLFTREESTFHGYPALYTQDKGCNFVYEWLEPDKHYQFAIQRCNYEMLEGETQSHNIPFDIRQMAEVFYSVVSHACLSWAWYLLQKV
jgi:hypothetical protein